MSKAGACPRGARFLRSPQREITFASNAGAYPSGATFQAPGLIHKYMPRLKRLARDKHSSLFKQEKKFYGVATWTTD